MGKSRAPKRQVAKAAGMILATVFSVTPLTACDDPFGFLYSFDRALPASRGAIFGKVIRDDGEQTPAAYAKIDLVGMGLVRQATDRGDLVISDLGAGSYILRVDDDEDGDGQPDRSRLVSTSLVVASKPDALGFGSGQQLVSVSLGEILLEGNAELTGDVRVADGVGTLVPPADIGLVGRALAFRTVNAGTEESPIFFQLGADAETHVDGEGKFKFNSVLSGEAYVAIALQRIVEGRLGPTVFVSEPTLVTLQSDEANVTPDLEVNAVDENLEDSTRAIEVSLNPPLEDRGAPYAIFVPPGAAMSQCQATFPTEQQFAHERIVTATSGAIARINAAPLGVWDMRLCGAAQFIDPATGQNLNTVDLAGATVFNLVVAPAPNGVETILVGPVVLSRDLDPCVRRVCPADNLDCEDGARTIQRDCDGDGRLGLPRFDAANDATVALYETCAADCGTDTGGVAATTTCTVGDLEYDCDDDGDLQVDTTEPPECLGPGLGDDRDGDGICSGADAYPTCSANDADRCAAGTVDVRPQVPEAFGGDPQPSDGGVDLEPDAGLDGGVELEPDGGVDVEVDAGNVEPEPLPVFDDNWTAPGAFSFGDPDGDYNVVAAIAHESAAVSVVVSRFDSTNARESAIEYVFDEGGTQIGSALLLAPQTADETFDFRSFTTLGGNHYFTGTYSNPVTATDGAIVCAFVTTSGRLAPILNFGEDADGCTRIPSDAQSNFVPGGIAVPAGPIYITGFGHEGGSIDPTFVKFAKFGALGEIELPNPVYHAVDASPSLSNAAGILDVFDTSVVMVDDGAGSENTMVLTAGTAYGNIARTFYAAAESNVSAVVFSEIVELGEDGIPGEVLGLSGGGADSNVTYLAGAGSLQTPNDGLFVVALTATSFAIDVQSAESLGSRDFVHRTGTVKTVDGNVYVLGAADELGVSFGEIWRIEPDLTTVPLLDATPGYGAITDVPVIQAISASPVETPKVFGALVGEGQNAPFFSARLNAGRFP